MSSLLKYTDLDLAIQTRMSNQAPNVTKRLEYINLFMRTLLTEYNIDVAKRSVIVSLKPNGVAVDLDTLITNLDCKAIDKIRPVNPELCTSQFSPMEEDQFASNYAGGLRENKWCLYTENRKRYLKLNSVDIDEDTTTSFKITYYTTNLAVDEDESGNDGFIPEAINSLTCYLLIPGEYKEMAVAGITKDLFLIALGAVDGATPASINSNSYKSQLEKFGFNKKGKIERKTENCVKVYPK